MTTADGTGPDELLVHFGFVRRLAADLVRDGHVAEEIAQSAMLAAFQQQPRTVHGWQAWFRGVVRNLAGSHFRQQRNRQARDSRYLEDREARGDAADGDEVVQALQRGEIRARVARAVMELDEPYRSVVVLRYLEERTPRQIAESLGRPLATVQTQLRRGLGILRQRLDGEWAGDREAWAKLLVPIGLECLKPTSVGTLLGTWGGLPVLVWVATTLLVGALLWWGTPDSESSETGTGPPVVSAVSPIEFPSTGVPAGPRATLLSPSNPSSRAVSGPPPDSEGLLLRVQSSDGGALGGAHVQVIANGSAEVLVAVDGTLSLDIDSPALLEVSHAGYLTGLKVVDPQQGDSAIVVLIPSGATELQVVDSDRGLPLAGAKVCAYPLREGPLTARVAPTGTGISIDYTFPSGSSWHAVFVDPASIGEALDTTRTPTRESHPSVPDEAAGDWLLHPPFLTTDSKGKVRVEVGRGLPLLVEVTCPGYQPLARAFSPDQWAQGGVLRLAPSAALELLRGPVDPKLRIEAALIDPTGGIERSATVAEGQRRAVFKDLPPGDYEVYAEAWAPGSGTSAPPGDPILVDARAHRVSVTARGNIRLTPLEDNATELLVRVTGRGRSLTGLVVTASAEDGQGTSRAVGIARVLDGEARLKGPLPDQLELRLSRGGEVLRVREFSRGGDASGEPGVVHMTLDEGILEVDVRRSDPRDAGRQGGRTSVNVLVLGPRGPDGERRRISRSGPQSTFLFRSLAEGVYGVWVVEEARAWYVEAEIRRGTGSAAFDLTRPPGGQVHIECSEDPILLHGLEVLDSSGQHLPFEDLPFGASGEAFDLDDNRGLVIELPLGSYRLRYAHEITGWAEAPLEVWGATQSLAVGRDGSAQLVDLFAQAVQGRPSMVRVFRAEREQMQPGSLGILMALDSSGRIQLHLRPGAYRVVDGEGRSASFDYLGEEKSIHVTLR